MRKDFQEEILEELAREKVDFEIDVESPAGSSRIAESSKDYRVRATMTSE